MITRTHRTALAALALLSLATISSTSHVRAAPLSPKQRYALPASVAGCRPTPYQTDRYADGSTTVRFSCRPPGHPGAVLLFAVNVANPSAEAARQTSDDYRKSFSKPMFDGGAVHTFPGAAHVWGVTERSSEDNRITLGGPVHRVAFVVAVFFHTQDEARWAARCASKVSRAIIARIP